MESWGRSLVGFYRTAYKQHLPEDSIHEHRGFDGKRSSRTVGLLGCVDYKDGRSEDLTLGHRVYRKPIHIGRYLHKDANHHPRQKREIVKNLVDRASRVCEPQYLTTELEHLIIALQANGNSTSEVRRDLRPRDVSRAATKGENPEALGMVFLPYVNGVEFFLLCAQVLFGTVRKRLFIFKIYAFVLCSWKTVKDRE